MNALPTLHGSIGYMFSSCDLDVKSSSNVLFKDMVERFQIHDRPRKPVGKEALFLGGKNVNAMNYLIYGRYYIPSSRLDALYSLRLSPSLRFLVAAVSNPRTRTPYMQLSTPPSSEGNVMFSLQHDTGRWCSEYSWSADDGMWGIRVLHNFGRLANEAIDVERAARKERERGTKRVDEEERMEGGLKGRLSVGAELYFSLKEKSAGGMSNLFIVPSSEITISCIRAVSTGVRFTTLPDASPPSISPDTATPATTVPAQTPTTLTATFNPMMGHMSAAYAARASRDLALCSRFDFNIYSYESEWTMGAEWWLRRGAAPPEKGASVEGENDEPVILDDMAPPGQDTPSAFPTGSISSLSGEVTGVVKARISTSSVSLYPPSIASFRTFIQDISLMWEGRVRNMLVSLGVVSDLSNRSKPIRSIGLELSYFSGPE
ncbi:Distribution and morphology protein [Ceratobasidium theobromae]|uniref:Mitochondrial distribution and morphology protein 10 n=1 Tax=Ceratobasidium theobromae TaxID=1582974 RepID=A0A5N5QXB9_9AGAM|nr:Distribution and morphology protein [Ceratobasidium theobromae]